MDSFNPTTKTQQAISAAVQAASLAGNPDVGPTHLLGALLAQGDGIAAPLLAAVGADAAAVRAEVTALGNRLPSASGSTVATPQLSRDALAAITAAQQLATEMGDEYVSTEHLLVGLADKGGAGRAAAPPPRRHPRRAARGVRQGARLGAGDEPGPRGQLPGAGEVRRRPHRARPQGRAGPGDRPRHRDPPRGAGALAAHQEQPGADRRAGRRQDRDRRGPRPADRGRRRARVAARQARGRARPRLDGGRREVPRRVRGAAQGRPQGDHRLRRAGRHVHRRAAHDRRRRRDRRGRDGRRQHDQADARPRRAADGRRHHARRVPPAHREGRRAGAPLPAGAGRRAVASRTPSASCAGSRSATRCTTASGSPTPRWSPPRRCPTATSPPGSCRTRPSTWSTRPRPGSAWRSTPGPSRSTPSSAPSAGWRSRRWRWRRSPTPRRCDRLAALRAELAERREELSALTARWQNEKGAIEVGPRAQGAARAAARRVGAGRARRRPRPRRRAALRAHPGAGEGAGREDRRGRAARSR